MNIREIAIARLKEYENNPRNNELAIDKVKSSIKRFGFLFPIIIDVNYVIVCGHTRVCACRELGIQTVPCIVADELNEEQVNFFRLVDNKTSEYSDWDFDKLKKELSMIDLTIDSNALLLEQFDLTPDLFDIKAEVSEISLPSNNFLEVSDGTEKPSTSVSAEKEDFEFKDTESHEKNFGDFECGNTDFDIPSDGSVQICESKKETKTPLPLNQFRFGDVSFYISKLELEQLNKKYAEYIDSSQIANISFVDYLLKEIDRLD